MAKEGFVLNKPGVRKLLRSDEMKAVCNTHARTICARCGDGYNVSTYTGRNRANASVFAESASAKRDVFENNTILKALK